ncbi:hypothetical protein PSEUDO8Z_190126 [Pseudomonas sp. 8Z]|nr:hypothetical protein PSEUDO8Z_190126 [Pseudomonas sp. 8Z]
MPLAGQPPLTQALQTLSQDGERLHLSGVTYWLACGMAA